MKKGVLRIADVGSLADQIFAANSLFITCYFFNNFLVGGYR